MGEGGKDSSAAAETGVAARGVWPCCCCNCSSSSAAVKGEPSPSPRASSSSPAPATTPASEEEEDAAGTAVLMPCAASSASSASGSWKRDEIGTEGSGGSGTGSDELVASGDCMGAEDDAAGAAEASAAATALKRCSVPGPAGERILPADCAGEVSAEAGVEVTLALPAPPPLRSPRLFRSRKRSKSPPTRSTTSAAICLSSRWRALAVANSARSDLMEWKDLSFTSWWLWIA